MWTYRLFDTPLQSTSQEPPHLPPVTNSSSAHRPPQASPQTSTACPPCTSATSHRIEYIQRNPSKSTCAMAKCKANCLSQKTPSARDSDFPKPEKETTRKTKARKPAHPLFVCPQPAEKEAAEKNAKFDTTTQCMLPVLTKREREKNENLDPGVSVGI